MMTTQTSPNFLVIQADQMAASALSAYGKIDRIATVNANVKS